MSRSHSTDQVPPVSLRLLIFAIQTVTLPSTASLSLTQVAGVVASLMCFLSTNFNMFDTFEREINKSLVFIDRLKQ